MHKNLTNHTVQLAKADLLGYAVNWVQSSSTPKQLPLLVVGVHYYCRKGYALSKGPEVNCFYCRCYFYDDAEAVYTRILYHAVKVFDHQYILTYITCVKSPLTIELIVSLSLDWLHPLGQLWHCVWRCPQLAEILCWWHDGGQMLRDLSEVMLVQWRDKRGRENKRVRDKGEIECESESKTKSEKESEREHRERDI